MESQTFSDLNLDEFEESIRMDKQSIEDPKFTIVQKRANPSETSNLDLSNDLNQKETVYYNFTCFS